MDRCGTTQTGPLSGMHPGFIETGSARQGLLRKWREQREFLQGGLYQALTLSYCEQDAGSVEAALQQLCSELIDYLCIGHFRVFQHGGRSELSRDPDRDGTEASSLRKLIHRHLGHSTDQLLAFSERIENRPTEPDGKILAEELKRLYRSLSLRFALEEQLLALPAH